MTENLYHLFDAAFRAAPDRPALVDGDGGGLTFGELNALSARFTGALANRGVVAGDRVVAQVEKSAAAVALYLACLRAGIIFIPLNTAYTPAEVEYFLNDAEPKLFVARETQGGLQNSAVLGTEPSSPFWQEALTATPTNAILPRSGDDIAAVLYTSGTTGRSKGAMLSHGNLSSNAQTLHRIWGFHADDVLLHALPVFHAHGLFIALHCAFLSASTTLFLPKFDAEKLCSLIPRATVMMGVPTFYTRLLNTPAFGREICRNMRLFISGSAPLTAETHIAFERRSGHRILERYGMTESVIITSNPLDGERIAGTVGYPLPDVELRIADADGHVLPHGEPGVIEIRSPGVFKGYWRMPEKTAAEFRPDGFLITGDIGIQAPDGRVTIVGRAKDLIVSGGLNIYPKEIETVIDAVPGVVESAVIGVPHADFGEAVVAVVVAEDGVCLEPDLIKAQAREKLARFKHPRHIALVESLPRNALGKVRKDLLRQQFAGLFGDG